MVLAAFSYRYDAHLVPGLLENLAQAVHGHVAWNDTGAEAALTPEITRRALLLDEAKRLGARWILAVDPDERYEDALAGRMPDLLARGEGNLWTFALREMFTPDRYRTDGVWGGKSIMRLFPLRAAQGASTPALHGNWIGETSGYTRRDARINLYHLRMATAERRRLRRELYAAADPARSFQAIGYDYLDDERGMRLEDLPEGRGFSPAFVEDHGLWSPDPGRLGQIGPDALKQRLHFIARSAARQGHEAACHVLTDLAAASPQDQDLPLLAASHALTAGLSGQALSIASTSLQRQPGSIFAQRLKVLSLISLDRNAEAWVEAEALPEGSEQTRAIRSGLCRDTEDFTASDATWRRWVSGAAQCSDGANLARSDLAVIVIGFRAQDGLADAVASVIAQDAEAEIVVVNSGGGEVRAALRPYLERIRLIEIEEPLFVGAARNIGIDASRAPYLAFLAGDCLAAPGWIAGRLRRHREGALTVATPVLPEQRATLVAEAANRLLYWGRRPDTPLAFVAPFGRSYHRRLFDLVGSFAPGLRINEDEQLNRLCDRVAAPVWAQDVLTRHRDPPSLAALLQAQVRRGENRAGHPPFRATATAQDRDMRLATEMRGRLDASLKALARDPAMSVWRRRAVSVVQWLANRADRFGIARGLARIAQAEALATDGADLAALAQAATLDPQDWRKAHRHATALSRGGDDAAVPEFRRGMALAPGEATLLDGLVHHLSRKGALSEALRESERAALAAPQSRKHWDIASDAAARAGRADLALAFSQQALALAPDLPMAHRRVARCHTAMGNPVAALFRNHAAERLEAGPSTTKGTGS